MPGHKGHIVGGLVVGLITHIIAVKLFSLPSPSPKFLGTTLIASMLGSLFPDIDTKSLGQRIFYILLAIPIIYTIITHRWYELAGLSLLSLFPVLVSHRGITHAPWFVCIIPLFIPPLFGWYIYLFFVIGGLSHLFLDYGFKRFFNKI